MVMVIGTYDDDNHDDDDDEVKLYITLDSRCLLYIIYVILLYE